VVAEAKNAKSFGFDNRTALCVGGLLAIGKMLPAIKLDHEFGSVTHEVGDVVCDRNLAPEASAAQAMIA
jgi:hypothetical protein